MIPFLPPVIYASAIFHATRWRVHKPRSVVACTPRVAARDWRYANFCKCHVSHDVPGRVWETKLTRLIKNTKKKKRNKKKRESKRTKFTHGARSETRARTRESALRARRTVLCLNDFKNYRGKDRMKSCKILNKDKTTSKFHLYDHLISILSR